MYYIYRVLETNMEGEFVVVKADKKITIVD